MRRGRRNRAERIVEAWCSEDGGLTGAPARSLLKIRDELAALAPAARAGVRLSRYLEDWQDEEKEKEAARRARRAVERDLEAGKPALDLLTVPLYPYQQQGVLHLAFTRRAILADEMGLGKTIQAIGACELLAQRSGVSRVLVVTPASLKGEWAEQVAAFTERSVNLIEGTARVRRTQYRRPGFYHLVSYEQVRQDLDVINELLAPDVVILDEAQRIKNWRTVTATQVKRLRSRYAFVLTGTPLENRIDEVYSIVQFLAPTLFGPLFRFNRDFYVLDEGGRPAGYRNLDEMHRRLRTVMLRRRKDEVEGDLPGRSVTNLFVSLAPEQEEQYAAHQADVARFVAIARRRPLRKQEFDRLQQSLACMRMACDTPFILDKKTRVAPKLDELVKLLSEVLEGTTSKAIVFSEWERMLDLARERSERIAPDSAWHTGSTPQKKRRGEIRRFKEDPGCRILFSTDSGSVGLNLQVADVVINLDLPWNPAKLEQRIARAWRKHQRRHVRVINLVSEGTIEHRMLGTLEHKRRIAESVIDGYGARGAVPLRSGRAALIDRVEALAVDEDLPSAKTARQPARKREDIQCLLERALGENLVDMRRFTGPENTLSAVVVVDSVSEEARVAVERALDLADKPQRPRVELVDAATWRVIDRLVQAGILHPGVREAGPQVTDERLARRRERVVQAGKMLESAKRQFAMARLLAGGGFESEAAAPLRIAFDELAECMALISEEDESPSSAKTVDPRLATNTDLPEEFAACREILSGEADKVNIASCLSVCDRAIAEIADQWTEIHTVSVSP